MWFKNPLREYLHLVIFHSYRIMKRPSINASGCSGHTYITFNLPKINYDSIRRCRSLVVIDMKHRKSGHKSQTLRWKILLAGISIKVNFAYSMGVVDQIYI